MSNSTNNKAKLWQVAFFTLNNTSTNLHAFILGFVTYYATGIAGLAVMIISSVLMAARLFDGIIDPAIGYIIDKTESKFGKFTPLIIVGNIISAGTIVIIFSVTHLLPESVQFIFFTAMLIINKIGYSLQCSVTKAGQTVLTNNPKQRPLYAIFDSVYNIGVFTGGQIFVSNYLVPKHGNFTLSLFTELNMYGLIISGICALFAIVGIWAKDKKEYYGLAEEGTKTTLREYWGVIKGNRPLQMLSISASFDKLAMSINRYSVVGVMLFGILLGDYTLSGTIGMITIIPTLFITFYIVSIARKTGLKKSYVISAWIGILGFAGLIVLFLLIDNPSTISLKSIGVSTVLFLILYSVAIGFANIPTTLVVPMIADVSDYETHKSGRYVPGMMGTIFSFIDQLVSSLAPTIVGAVVGIIGYKSQFPEVGDSLTTPLFVTTLVLAFGLPALCLIVSIIAMKFYHLDAKRMEDIQKGIAQIKSNVNKDDIAAL
ncbi:MFS transporter [Metabacillus sediminilitoris]|uniref:Glucuronide permease n=1 Tax=Metabacillus sediminilitoris TaxID=2567941 RepID=A0A4S4BTW5_9BACI|nr:MFS transporter [Metabacillus sediminilitoris]QGQ44884.1 glucuronide permease [Metabacillus sediminilitoris]THF78517.1 glucuronide permease [Metabacillus sediminilitoris]